MAESRSFSPEIWVSDRDAFIFLFRDRRCGDVATFCVPEATLKELRPGCPFLREEAFDALRSWIYEAAIMRIRTGISMSPHVMTPHELRALRSARHVLPARSPSQQARR